MKSFKQFLEEGKNFKEVDALIRKYKKKATEDYQNRGGDYPASGIPDTITVGGWQNEFFMDYSFKNTSEREAKRWVERDLGSAAKQFKITTGQDGSYRDDWVIVYVQKVF